jgi:long-chain acyl-CoA synthetase
MQRTEETPLRTGSIPYPGNLSLLLDRAADLFPDRDGIGFGDTVLSFREYHDRVCRLTRGLVDLRIERGDRVLLLSHNSLGFALIAHAVLRAGAVLVPVNPGIRPNELAHIVTETLPRCAFAEARSLPRFFKTYKLIPTHLIPTLVTIEKDVPLTVNLSEIDHAEPCRTCEPMQESDLAMILYTAAMEGYALGAQLTHGSIFHDAVCCADACFGMSATAGEVALCLLPLYHAHGFTSGFLVPLAGCVSTYPIDAFRETGEIIDLMERRKVTQMASVPAVYEGLLRPLGDHADICSRVRNLTTGGAKASVELIKQYKDRLGVDLFEGYGLTEASPVVTWNPSDRPPRAGTAGIPLPCCQVKIVDEHGGRLPPGAEGEVLVRGLNVFSGYYLRPEKTAKVLDSNGWFRTGDLGVLDEDNYLTWTGLRKDMINIFGLKVYPRELERLLLQHPEVERVRVYAEEHDRYGAIVCCELLPKPGKTVTERLFRKWCRQTVSSYKIPRKITLLQ